MPLPAGRVPVPCIPDSKIGGYLLDVNHGEGGPKAQFFLSRGFTLRDPRPLIAALLEHARPDQFARSEQNRYVTKYVYEGPMPMPYGGSPRIRSVWRPMDEGAFMALVTAHPI